jgi:hypothetical protein
MFYRLAPAPLVRVVVATVLALPLCAFRPFSPVTSVCPGCPEKGDRLQLADGRVLLAQIVAKNQDGYIAEKYGELRLIQYSEVKKVEWTAGAEPKGLDGFDQILLKNKDQTVLLGTLVQVENGKPLTLRSAKGQIYTVHAGQALLYYQRGQRKAPPKEAVETPPPAAEGN